MSAPTIVIIDNHDSFTFNVYQYFLIGGANTHVVPADHIDDCQELIATADGLVLSPGPGSPEQATASLSVLTQFFDQKPILGICLGHQVICHHMGAAVSNAPRVMHGKTSMIETTGEGLFNGLPARFRVARYHSLIAASNTIPGDLMVTALSCDDQGVKEVMAVQHNSLPIHAVQFHPEAIGTEHGQEIISNFIRIVQASRP